MGLHIKLRTSLLKTPPFPSAKTQSLLVLGQSKMNLSIVSRLLLFTGLGASLLPSLFLFPPSSTHSPGPSLSWDCATDKPPEPSHPFPFSTPWGPGPARTFPKGLSEVLAPCWGERQVWSRLRVKGSVLARAAQKAFWGSPVDSHTPGGWSQFLHPYSPGCELGKNLSSLHSHSPGID